MNTVQYRKPRPVATQRDYTKRKPLANVIKGEDGLYIEMAIPGVAKESIEITLENNELTISAEEEVVDRKMNRKEYDYSQFSRTFILPEEIDGDHIEASLENGILKVSLPLKPEEKPKLIQIK